MPKLTSEDVLKMINGGESEMVEFKTSLPGDKVIARNLVAFANTSGGVMIIGVDDNGKVIGLADGEVERTRQRLHHVSQSLCNWTVDVGQVNIAGRTVVYIAIERAPEHLTPVMSAAGEIFARKGSQNIQLNQAERLLFYQLHRPTSVDSVPAHPGRRCKVFVAMSFRVEEEPALIDYYHAIERASTSTNLPIDLSRMDLIEGDYEISQEVMKRIEDADVLIADFTLNSCNVYFELGYARGLRKRVIQTARKETSLEFDTRNWRTLFYRNATELEERILLELVSAHEEFTKRLAEENLKESEVSNDDSLNVAATMEAH
jgi:nucleoside 2-deoxyribosyltransferase